MRTEVPLREGAAGAGLKVPVESRRAVRVGERDRDKQLPRTVLRRVPRPCVIVGFEPGRDIGRQADVVTVRVASAVEDIDKTLGPIGHAGTGAKGRPEAKHQCFGAIHRSGRWSKADSASPCTGERCRNRPPSQRSGWIPSSRCFGGTDFACTWLAQTKLSEESGKPEESEVWRRRE